MIRKIIRIDEEKCNGCGICADVCHEGALGIINGKATLLREDYCDGLGDCLPACPMDAIFFEEREALAYDEQAVLTAMAEKKRAEAEREEAGKHIPASFSCPGSMSKEIRREPDPSCGCSGSAPKEIHHEHDPSCGCSGSAPKTIEQCASPSGQSTFRPESRLTHWPVQIKLAPFKAPYFDGANLLIAADCTAYAYGNFHEEFMRNKVTLIGCPKLDMIDYSEKLTHIIAENDIKSVTVARMEVPCCGGIEMAVKQALMASGKFIPWNIVTISIDGKILD